ncbi:hypothetical protein PsorP6_014357 [Peronosclerospora sorghi]|uniref:Uncharacterized protein n=1 Tax=Peronosclerospora sorghi TaxID=230839 RepID=A0ACC0VGU4_9STRA|nr:hypothetical protein PsorP6_014357 [Peronosclerospora sorghi]
MFSFGEPLLMRVCSDREDIEVKTEWGLEDNNQTPIRSVGGDTGSDETREATRHEQTAQWTSDHWSALWRLAVAAGSTAQGVYSVATGCHGRCQYCGRCDRCRHAPSLCAVGAWKGRSHVSPVSARNIFHMESVKKALSLHPPCLGAHECPHR